MSEVVQVTVAPGCHVSVSPHPSGIPGLKPLVLSGGSTLTVTRAKATELYACGLVLHPLTGEMPPPIAAEAGMTVQYGSGPRVSASNPLQQFPDWKNSVQYPDPPPVPPNPWADRAPPSVTQFPDLLGLGSITDANGRPWPPFYP